MEEGASIQILIAIKNTLVLIFTVLSIVGGFYIGHLLGGKK